MPFAGFDDWDECVRTMTEEEGHDVESAENICGALQAEAKSDHGDVQALRDALSQGAGLIADVGVDLVSGVDVPAVDSKWVMTKSDREGHDYRVNSPILLQKDDDSEQRISYAAAMIPREPDKEGDVVATPTVEKAAHDFLKSGGGVDTDHSLIDGEGDVVESWVLKEERTFDLPGGENETYGAGTWMVGIKWGAEAWDRIKSGELTGLSIYGMAEHVPLERAAKSARDSPVSRRAALHAVGKQPEDDPCWDGYEMVGTKTDEFGNEVPNCVPVAEASAAKQLDIPLANESVVHLVYESRTAAEKASEEIGLDGRVHEHEFDGMTVWMPGETHEEFVDTYMDMSEEAEASVKDADTPDTPMKDKRESEGMGTDSTDGAGDATSDADGGDGGGDGPTVKDLAASVDELQETVASVKDAVETTKQESPQEAAGMLAEEYDMGTGDVLDILAAAQGADADAVLSAVEEAASASESEAVANENDDGMEDDDEDDEEDMEKSTEDALMSKGHSGNKTREAAIEAGEQTTGGTGVPSYAAAADKYEEEN